MIGTYSSKSLGENCLDKRREIRESFSPLFLKGYCNSFSISYAAVTRMFRAIKKDLKLPDPPLDVLDDITSILHCIDYANKHLITPENENRMQDLLNIEVCIRSYLKKAAKKKEEIAKYFLNLEPYQDTCSSHNCRRSA